MIWWLAFEKKLFQFWRKIWIQVVVILLQLYLQRNAFFFSNNLSPPPTLLPSLLLLSSVSLEALHTEWLANRVRISFLKRSLKLKFHVLGVFFLDKQCLPNLKIMFKLSHQFIFHYLFKVTKNKKISCPVCLPFF